MFYRRTDDVVPAAHSGVRPGEARKMGSGKLYHFREACVVGPTNNGPKAERTDERVGLMVANGSQTRARRPAAAVAVAAAALGLSLPVILVYLSVCLSAPSLSLPPPLLLSPSNTHNTSIHH